MNTTEKANKKQKSVSLIREESGLSTVEYVILLVLVVVGAIGVWQAFGKSVMEKVNDQGNQIEGLEADSPG